MVMESAMQRQIEGAQETYASMSEEIHYLQESNAELLAALKRVMSWIENWSPEFSNDPDWPTDRDAARAAIAKATVLDNPH